MINRNFFEEVELEGSKISSITLPIDKYNRSPVYSIESDEIKKAFRWISRLSPFDSISLQWGLAGCFERLNDIKVDEYSLQTRNLLLDFQKVLAGIYYLHKVYFVVGEIFRNELYLHLLEKGLRLQESLSGSRIFPEIICIGGLTRKLKLGEVQKIMQYSSEMQKEISEDLNDMLEDVFFESRLFNVFNISIDLFNSFFKDGLMDINGLSLDEIETKQIVEKLKSKKEITLSAYDRVLAVYLNLLNALKNIRVLARRLPNVNSISQKVNCKALDGASFFNSSGSLGKISVFSKELKINVFTPISRVSVVLPEMLIGTDIEDLELALASIGYDFEEGGLF